jgi:redox-sensitive bicupin YhaK (pirin superfamily)
VEIEAREAAQVFLLAGQPLREPIVQHGPFVMNTEAEIQQALDDLRAGRLGQPDADS